ncbi:MAG TPA: ribbon-helix-helix domain-containing protein [Conexibacter sp.]|nr:ribbon-helix-helix domain-containing protein [Conexibacter sp.]
MVEFQSHNRGGATGGHPSGSIVGMKLSVSLPSEDVEFLDAYASAHASPSRSAVVQAAIHALRLRDLGDAYAAAADEWSSGEDADLWDVTAGDGL